MQSLNHPHASCATPSVDFPNSLLADPGQDVTKEWFEGTNAPFGTLSAKIKLGQALAIYGEQMASQLNAIREIRNAFAHRMLPLDFANAAVQAACRDVAPFMRTSTKKDPNYKLVFITGCYAIGRSLIDFALEEGGKEMTLRFP